MTIKTKDRTGGKRQTQKAFSTLSNSINAGIKAAFVRCEVWIVIPANVVKPLIQSAGIKNA